MVFPSYVLHSLFITPDVPITLFTLLVIYFTLRYLVKNDEKSIYIAAAFAAINTAEKYPGLISLGIVILGILIKSSEFQGEGSTEKRSLAALKTLKVLAVFLVALF